MLNKKINIMGKFLQKCYVTLTNQICAIIIKSIFTRTWW